MQPLISVVIPCYNGNKYLETAIESFLCQKISDMELIIVNDGSTDDTIDRIQKYRESDRITIKSVANGGTGYARNIGLLEAKGKWVCFLDQDDALMYDAFSDECRQYLELEYQNKTDIIYTPKISADMFFNKFNIFLPEAKDKITNHLPKLEFWCCIYNREYLINNNIRFCEFRQLDIESAFRYRAFCRTDNIKVKNDLAFYVNRNNPESVSHTWNFHNLRLTKAKAYIDLFNETCCADDKPFLGETVLQQIVSFYKASVINGRASSEQNSEIHEIYRRIKPFIGKLNLSKSKKRMIFLSLIDPIRNVFPIKIEKIPQHSKNKCEGCEWENVRDNYFELSRRVRERLCAGSKGTPSECRA